MIRVQSTLLGMSSMLAFNLSAQHSLHCQSEVHKAFWAVSQKIQRTIRDKLGAVSASLDVQQGAAARPLSWVPTSKLYCAETDQATVSIESSSSSPKCSTLARPL